MSVLKGASLDPKAEVIQSATFFDDFFSYLSGGLFTSVAGSSGTSAADDTLGVDAILYTTAATLNDAQGIKTTKANFLPTSGVGMYCESAMTYANQATNNAAVYFGFASSSTFNNTSVLHPAASGSYCAIYKLASDVTWRCITCGNGVIAADELSSNVACTDGSYKMRIDITNFDGLNAQVTYLVNDVVLRDSKNNIIYHKLPYASLVKMMVVDLVQAGSANAQTKQTHYITAGKFRNLSLSF